MTDVIEAARQGFITGAITWGETWPGLVALAGLIGVFGALALRGMRRFFVLGEARWILPAMRAEIRRGPEKQAAHDTPTTCLDCPDDLVIREAGMSQPSSSSSWSRRRSRRNCPRCRWYFQLSTSTTTRSRACQRKSTSVWTPAKQDVSVEGLGSGRPS